MCRRNFVIVLLVCCCLIIFSCKKNESPASPTTNPGTSATSTPTFVLSPTSSYTPTETGTVTNTATSTQTGTFTSTQTVTPTVTYTFTAMPTNTLTPVATCNATTTIFGSTQTQGGGTGSIWAELGATAYTLATASTLSQISFYETNPSNLGRARLALYANDSVNNKPTTLIVQASFDVSVTGGGWYTQDVPSTDLAAGTYWLAIMTTPNVIGTLGPDIPLDTGDSYLENLGSFNFPVTFDGYQYGSAVAVQGKVCHN